MKGSKKQAPPETESLRCVAVVECKSKRISYEGVGGDQMNKWLPPPETQQRQKKLLLEVKGIRVLVVVKIYAQTICHKSLSLSIKSISLAPSWRHLWLWYSVQTAVVGGGNVSPSQTSQVSATIHQIHLSCSIVETSLWSWYSAGCRGGKNDC